MIPYKVFLPIIGAVTAFVVDFVLLIVGVSPGWAVAGIIFIAFVTTAATGHLIHIVDVFLEWSTDARTIAFRLIVAAILSDAVVAIVVAIQGFSALPEGLLWLVGVTVVQMLASSIADTYLGRLHPRALRERQRRAEAQEATSTDLDLRGVALVRDEKAPNAPENSHDVLIMRMALKKVKLGWLLVRNPEPLHDGKEFFGISFDIQITAEAMSNSKRRSLSVDSAEPIAVALSELLGKDLETRWIGIQKLARSGGYSITVTTQDVMARLYPFVDEDDWADINEPMLLGYGLNAKEVMLLLQKHGQFLGKTRSGKTSLINCVLAYVTRCKNAVVWVCGTMKLYDMLAAWLEIYLNTGVEMPFDLVACGPKDTAECLAALLRIGRYRQSLPLDEREGLPDIICILDEASFALRNTTIAIEIDGRKMTMSATCGDITQGVGSAGCWLKLSTQRDTNDQYGPSGGDIQAQMGYTASFATQDGLSIGRQLGDFKLPPPKHKGEFYLKDDDGAEYPIIVKGRYIQENDRKRPVLHDGITVKELSWSRQKFKTYLDEGSQRAAGDFYANRHTLVTQEFLDYLRRKPEVGASTDASSGGVSEGVEFEAEAIELAEQMGMNYHDMPDAQQEAYRIAAEEMRKDVPDIPDVKPNMPVNGPLVDQVLWTIRRTAKPITSREIIDGMRDAGFEVKSEGSVHNLLGKLVGEKVLIKDVDRLFRLAE